ncbi:uncharacterized protein LOC131332252 isoform X2 [Rhododendron vialii]|uniref:uncharacterized protein LOC131332252 isoform X2 n=1 Tax=Rhododendron vialii TaxID=182163 RepID=UPI00266051F9|nr:uncharacterized protein LOC131332252 isoform X2 [Rhododendron vialii]
MNLKLHSGALSSSRVRHEFPANRTLLVSAKIKEPEAILRRRLALRKADRELSRGNYKTALTLVKQLQGKPGGLRGFGAAKQVPRRISSLNQLKPGGIDTSSPQYLVDSILDSIKRSTEFQLSEEVSASELESLTHESVIEDHLMCTQHEAGHFVVGYLLGALPKRYVVSKMEALMQNEFVGGGVEFMGFEFLREVDTGGILQMNLSRQKPSDGIYKGKISSTTLNRFSCVILGGLVAEHLVFGYSQGLHGDVEKLNRVLRWMGFEESEIDSHLKWAVMNTLLILVRHQEARSRLAETMALGKSVGSCIDVIENNLNDI